MHEPLVVRSTRYEWLIGRTQSFDASNKLVHPLRLQLTIMVVLGNDETSLFHSGVLGRVQQFAQDARAWQRVVPDIGGTIIDRRQAVDGHQTNPKDNK